MKWFYQIDQYEVGPLTETALRELTGNGVINEQTLVRREDSTEWQQFSIAFSLLSKTERHSESTVKNQQFKFHCPHCQQKISADASQSGISAQCPTCGGDFVVPEAPKDMMTTEPYKSSHEEQPPDMLTPQETALTTPTQVPGSSYSFGELVKDGSIAMRKSAQIVKENTKVGWLGLKRVSKQAALRAQIEKLRQIDLRKALHDLGEKAFNNGVLTDTLQTQYQAIYDLDARIAALREKSRTVLVESKMAALKQMGKETANAGHAKSLSMKREHLITGLGRELQSQEADWSMYGLAEEWNTARMIDQQILHKEQEIKELGREGACDSASSGGTQITPFSYRSAVPLFVCCLGFGWLITWFLPMRIFTTELTFSSALGVILLALPPVLISYYGIGRFLEFPKTNYKHLLGAMVFTMLAGIMILLTFYKIAEASQSMESRFYGKATPLVLAVKLIGWSADFRTEGNFFQRLFGSVVHTGFCEEVTKLLPLFALLILNRKKDGIPDLRAFLMIAFFSGLGFGIAEAIKSYSPWSGNPVLTSNVIRWYACVPLHAIYTIIDASLLWLLIPEFKKAKSIGVASVILLTAATVVAVIHGLYNTISGLHNLVGLILDGGAIVFMVYIVRLCLDRDKNSVATTNSHPFPTHILPTWLRSKDRYHPSFGRMFAGAGILLLISTVFTFSPPSPSSSAAQSFADRGYQANEADRRAIERFEDTFSVTQTIGKRNGLNDFEILWAAVDATDWSGATPSLRNAVSDFKSIKSGEAPESRNRKLEPMMTIMDFY